MVSYTNGLDLWATWETDTFEALLLNAGQFVPSHVFVADLIAAAGTVETSAVGYLRAAVTSPVRNVDNGSLFIRYQAADLSFGSMAAGQKPIAAVVYKKVTDDSDSLLMAWLGLSGTRDTADESPWRVSVFDFAQIVPREVA